MKFVALLEWNATFDALEDHPLFSRHEAHMSALYAQGALTAGGPLLESGADEGSSRARSLLLLEASDVAAARAALEADPACGPLYTARLHAWLDVFSG